MTEKAVLAGGCFWGMQDLFRRHPGVVSTRVGYTGDPSTPNATYRRHGNHAEAIEITFDPSLLSYRQILEFFFQIHDPSTRNRQGNDIGAGYRSAIFFETDEQKRSRRRRSPMSTPRASGRARSSPRSTQASDFWLAEPEHQDYLERYPNGYTCHYVRPEWQLGER